MASWPGNVSPIPSKRPRSEEVPSDAPSKRPAVFHAPTDNAFGRARIPDAFEPAGKYTSPLPPAPQAQRHVAPSTHLTAATWDDLSDDSDLLSEDSRTFDVHDDAPVNGVDAPDESGGHRKRVDPLTGEPSDKPDAIA